MKNDFDKLFDMSFDPLAIIDLDGNFKQINRAFSQILGWTIQELNGITFWDLNKHNNDLEISHIVGNLKKGHPLIFVESQISHQDGHQRSLRWTAYPNLESNSISLIMRNMKSHDESMEIFRLAIEASPTVIFIVNNGKIEYANQLSELVFGYTQNEMIDKSIEMLVPQHLRPLHENYRFRYEEKPYLRLMGSDLPLLGQRKDGIEFPVDIGLNPVNTPDGPVVICSVIDITKRKAAEKIIAERIQQLENDIFVLDKLASTDELTAINNRRALFKQLELHYRMAQNESYPISFALLDIDDFKHYNDSYGHLNGDKALKSIAKILETSMRKTEIVARYGGEEFGAILPNTDSADSKLLAERIRKMIEKANWPFRKITISVGIATLYPKPTDTVDAFDINKLIIMADKALYFSKGIGKNAVTHFNDLEITQIEDLSTWSLKHETPTDH